MQARLEGIMDINISQAEAGLRWLIALAAMIALMDTYVATAGAIGLWFVLLAVAVAASMAVTGSTRRCPVYAALGRSTA